MHQMNSRPHIRSHWLARLVNKRVLITYDDTGITISQFNKQQTLTWLEIIKPILFDASWFGGRLTLFTQSETLTFKLLSYSAKRTHHTNMLECWIKHHAPELNKALHLFKQKLTQQYFRSSVQYTLQAEMSLLAKRWQALPDGLKISADTSKNIKKLASLNPISSQHLHRCRSYFIQNELANLNAFFEHLSSRPLTAKQRQACVINDDNNLVLAGAGSGKTSVMVGRVAYLLKRGLAKPAQILLLAYGKDAAQEMDIRLKNTLKRQDIKCATFHSLALAIISQAQGFAPKISVFATNSELKKAWLLEQFHERIKTQLHYKNDVVYLINGLCVDGKNRFNPQSSFEVLSNSPEFKTVQNQVLRFFDVVRAASQSPTVAPHYFADATTQRTFECYFNLVSPLLDAYKKHLATHQELDFDDMIFNATKMLHTGKFKATWQHILVDEFQDISEPRAQLLKALTDNVADCRLFAVGDDWQSIYRFSGSNHYFITNFHAYFGAGCTVNLDRTFRFNNKIAEVANNFVMQNPAQLKKELTSHVLQKHNAITLLFEDHKKDVLVSLTQTLRLIDANARASVFILARFGFLLPDSAQLALLKKNFSHLTLETHTVHSSKGKEADYVILVGLNEGRYGFPAKQPDELFFDAYLPKQDDFAYAEERRLFYVALTRAKKHVYLIAPTSGASEFITELITQQYDVTIHQQG